MALKAKTSNIATHRWNYLNWKHILKERKKTFLNNSLLSRLLSFISFMQNKISWLREWNTREHSSEIFFKCRIFYKLYHFKIF
jgi:hypothetical protein